MSKGNSNKPAGATVVAAPRPAPVDMNAPIDMTMTVNIMLSLNQINQLLQVLGTQPLAQVIELFGSIKSQGDMAVMAFRMGSSGQQQPAPPPPAAPGSDNQN